MIKRLVNTGFWTNPKVIDNYSVEDKYFALYLTTNEKSTQVGIYYLPKKVMSFETGFTSEVIHVLLNHFSKQYGKIIYNNETQEIAILDNLECSILSGGKPLINLLQKELSKVRVDYLNLETYQAMSEFWERSIKKVDKEIQRLFKNELENRGLTIQTEKENKQMFNEPDWLDSILLTDASKDTIELINDEDD